MHKSFKQFKEFSNHQRLPLYISLILISMSSILVWTMKVESTIILDRNQVILRERPESDAKAIKEYEQSQKIHLLKTDNNWLLVRTTDNQQGWVAQWYLDNPAIQKNSKLHGQVLDTIPLYQSPDTKGEIIQEISKSEYVELIQESLGWARVFFDNSYGFVRTKDLYIMDENQVIKSDPIAESIDKTDDKVKVRTNNHAGFDQPSYDSAVIYQPQINEEFDYLDSVNDQDGREWYLVKNQSGLSMYIDSNVASFNSDSANHQNEPKVKSLKEATVVLDPGHGGNDVGALSSDVIFEKVFNLDTAMILKQKLEEAGAKVIMTRTDDSWVDLDERAIICNNHKADVFLSLHYDALDDPSVHGTATYYFHEADYDLAVSVNQSLSRQLPLANNGTTFGNFQVLRENKQPALLLELGYMTNYNDLQFIQSPAYYEQIADAIVKGLQDYYASVSYN